MSSIVKKIIRFGSLILSLKKKSSANAYLLYGGMLPKNSSGHAGGAVKLLQLSKEFPDSLDCGNILYLITSCLPFGAVTLANAAKRLGIKFVLNQNGVAYPAWASEKTRNRINKRNRTLLQLADHVVYQSKFCQSSCEKWVGKHLNTSSVIYNPVDTNAFKSVPNRDPKYDLLLMGSHSQRERVSLALQVIESARAHGLSWKLNIAGRFLWKNAEKEIRDYIKDKELNSMVAIRGPYSQSEAPNLYNDTRVLLHIQDKDASPTVPLEAMACGLPVVSLRSGGLPELIPDLLGELLSVDSSWDQFQFPSVDALYSAVQRQIDSPMNLKLERSAYVEKNFSANVFLEKHRELFASILRKK